MKIQGIVSLECQPNLTLILVATSFSLLSEVIVSAEFITCLSMSE